MTKLDPNVQQQINNVVDRDTPPDNRREVVDQGVRGEPITREDVDRLSASMRVPAKDPVPTREELMRIGFERSAACKTKIPFKRGGTVFAEEVPDSEYVDSGIQAAWIYWQDAWAEAERAREFLAPSVEGWLINKGEEEDIQYRTIVDGMYVWTRDIDDAIRFSRRQDAELFAGEDSEDIRIRLHSFPQGNASAKQ